MSVLLRWVGAMVLGGAVGLAFGAINRPSVDEEGADFLTTLDHKIRHDLDMDTRWVLTHRMRRAIQWPGEVEYDRAFGLEYSFERGGWEDCIGPDPELLMPHAQELARKHVAECAKHREDWARWEREHEDHRTAMLATTEGWTPPGAR